MQEPAAPEPTPGPTRARLLGALAARRGRSNLQARVLRLRQRSFLIAQVAVAAALAWFIAHDVLEHPRPFFAPVAAIVSLGMSYGQRLRRVGEVTAGGGGGGRRRRLRQIRAAASGSWLW